MIIFYPGFFDHVSQAAFSDVESGAENVCNLVVVVAERSSPFFSPKFIISKLGHIEEDFTACVKWGLIFIGLLLAFRPSNRCPMVWVFAFHFHSR